jgi:hypothetical protein
MAQLRAFKASAGYSEPEFQKLRLRLNAKHRVDDDPLFAHVAGLSSEFPVDLFGFDDQVLRYSSNQFFLRTIQYLNSGTPGAPGHPLDPMTVIQMPPTAHDFGFPHQREVTPIAWTDNEDEFVRIALERAGKSYVNLWFNKDSDWSYFGKLRAAFLMRMQKFGELKISRKIWHDAGGGESVALFKPCPQT